MVDELVACSACGTKNTSHRSVCLSCGGELSVSKGPTKAGSEPFVKDVTSPGKTLSTPKKWSIAALLVVGMYFGLTWFFFGSSHPCGILEARQRPYVVKNRAEFVAEMLKEAENATKDADPSVRALVIATIMTAFADPKATFNVLHERIWNQYTPARCIWEALAWNPDPHK